MKLASVILSATTVLITHFAHAGGCHLEYVTPSKELASTYLASVIRDKVLEVETAMNARGEELKVVMVARSGESLDSLAVVQDKPEVALQDYMDQLADIAYANKEGRLETRSGKGIPSSSQPKIPKQLIEDKKLKYSHFGFLIKKDQYEENGDTYRSDWIYIVHLLAECDTSKKRYGDSDIFFQTFDQFFWDTKVADKKKPTYRALISVPTPEIQDRLYTLLHDGAIGTGSLHQPRYNVAATPFKLRAPKYRKKKNNTPDYHQLVDQNSNQWPLEILAAATRPLGQVTNRVQAQDVLWETNFHPSILDPGGIKESMACSLKKGPFWDASNLLNCTDQVFRRIGLVHLITVDSVNNYMTRNNFLARHIYRPEEPGIYEVFADKAKLEKIVEAGEELEKLQKEIDKQVKKKGKDKSE